MRQSPWRGATLDVRLRPSDQLTMVLGFCLMAAAVAGVWLGPAAWRGGLTPWRPNPPLRHVAIDPNQADWPELTLLPGVGETLARRIVQSRETAGPFATPRDVQRVKGIGPAKLQKMRTWLSIQGRPPELDR